jgi:hypothetical protein
MIYSVFSIFDAKAEAYLPPFILPKKAMAERTFSDCVNSETHQFGANPQDYTLFELGTFNDENGQFLLHRAVISCGNGLEFRKPDFPRSPEIGAAEATEGRSNGRTQPQANKSKQALTDVAPVLTGAAGKDPS